MKRYNKGLVTACITALQSVIDQGVPSMGLIDDDENADAGETCFYRGNNGKRCAVGWLISDDYYETFLEGCSAYDSCVCAAIQNSLGITISKDDSELLSVIQGVHDDSSSVVTGNYDGFIDKVKRRIAQMIHNKRLPKEFEVLL